MDALDILIFGAHPDDAEIGMGATIAKHTHMGYKVGICDLTKAEMSSNGTTEQRGQEAEAAGMILGLSMRSTLGLPDRGLFMNEYPIQLITSEIRKHKPRVVFAPYWQDRHPDHVACSHLVQEAVFNAKLRKYMPNQEAFAVEKLLFYYINDTFEPDMIVDVSGTYAGKTNALKAYRSQFDSIGIDPSEDRVSTAINQGYLDRVEIRDRLLGLKYNVEYAEGFAHKHPIMVHSLC